MNVSGISGVFGHALCVIMLYSLRIESIEFLDEQELLIQLLQHYCLSCGYNDSTEQGKTGTLHCLNCTYSVLLGMNLVKLDAT